jgi:hypothetical protein
MEYLPDVKFICELEDGLRGEHMGIRKSPKFLYERATAPYLKSANSAKDYAKGFSAQYDSYLNSDSRARQEDIEKLKQNLSRKTIIKINLLHPWGSRSSSLDDIV